MTEIQIRNQKLHIKILKPMQVKLQCQLLKFFVKNVHSRSKHNIQNFCYNIFGAIPRSTKNTVSNS